MIRSRPVEVEGRFVGIAVLSARDWHFVPLEPVLDDLHGARFPSPEEAAHTAALVLHRARQPLRRAA
jgi:hypothetical protein